MSLSEKVDTICVADIHRKGPSGFTVLQLPAHHVTSVTLPECSLEQIAEKMLELQREHHIDSFWTCAPVEAFGHLRWLGLPIRRVGP